MCGIAGFIARPGKGKSMYAPRILQRLEHRGPDDQGWLRFSGRRVESGREWTEPDREPEVLLLHRRLAILDTSNSGWQPMASADGRYHVIYNGEIYNYKELREELQGLGHRFQTRCDTEVLLAACEQWGTGALTRFIGMFAFALLDTTKRTVLLARDCFGIKPLYYSTADGFLCFGSEIKALLAFGSSHPEANAGRLLSYLRYGMTDFGSQTLLRDIRQVPAAHSMEISLDRPSSPEPRRYWSADAGDELEISFEEATQHVRELFLRNVELHLRSDVPLGAALSGGIDSSAIVMAIRHLDSRADIHAFSFIAEDSTLSEERWIDIVGAEAGAHVHKVRVTAGELADDLTGMMHFHDEPFGSTSAYAQYQVFRAAGAAGIKVMLDGQGADEILGGYMHYQGARLASLVRQGRWSEAAQLVHSFSGANGVGRYKGLAHCADYLLSPSLQSIARRLAGRDPFPAWLDRTWFAKRGVGPEFMHYTLAREVLHDTLSRSVTETLPGLLRYEDRNSMAFSVESRVPFLTAELVSFLGRLPESYLISSTGTSKAVFRAAMRGIVPNVILDRRDKLGFATPEGRWLNALDVWVGGILASDSARQLPFLNIDVARAGWAAVRNGKRPFSFGVWRWINLIRWSEELGVVYS
ncbi:MAG TPA: asparagine synthase (glutamine-hydrolyzing) [Acidisarcina sp.]